jgi:teichoic acid transport system ATP-binding protein
MELEYAIEFNHVAKIYTLKSKDKKYTNDKSFYALKDLNFKIQKGEVVGILGTNGSGKSTMSLVLSEIADVDEGDMKVNGTSALIAINTGLNQQLTGLENIELKGALLGLKKDEVNKIIDGVIDFAEIGDFLYQPVKKYSSGMKSRLGFSINLYLNPDILIVDEALSVGDKGFAQKCINKMIELKEQGKTIVFISHTLKQVRDFCDTAMWIEGGQLREYGEVSEVCDHYSEYVSYLNHLSKEQKNIELEKKFEKRLLPDHYKESFVDKFLRAIKN